LWRLLLLEQRLIGALDCRLAANNRLSGTIPSLSQLTMLSYLCVETAIGVGSF